MLVVLNLSQADQSSVVLAPTGNAGSIKGAWVELFTGKKETLDTGTSLHLGPWEYRVYVQGKIE